MLQRPPLRFITEDDGEAVRTLEAKMCAIYQNSGTYPPFAEESSQPELWSIVIARARRQLEAASAPCRVLEIGSGRSGFHRALAEAGLVKSPSIHYTAHDVTEANLDFLRARADETAIGPVCDLRGSFDIVFHSYVLEHIVRPRAFLEKVLTLLTPTGLHIFSCPRYDAPGIAPPSLAHYGCLGRLHYLLFNVCRALFGTPRFPLLADPAILHGPYYRDADAIHCVALRDILRLHRDRATIEQFRVPGYSVRDRLVKTLMGLHLIITKTGQPPAPQTPIRREPG